MKTIGIISMQRVINYGSFLQAYALQKTIETLNNDVVFLDIEPGIQLETEIEIPTDINNRGHVSFVKRVDHTLFSFIRKIYFNQILIPRYFYRRHNDAIDGIIIGSDEVFNCLQPSKWGFSMQLLGDTYVPSASYAASFGFTTYELLKEYNVDKEVADALNKLTDISVRDNNSKECIMRLINVEPEKHLDPVMIYNWDGVVKHKKKYKEYILIYAYDNRITDPHIIKAIMLLAQKNNLSIISFGVYQRWCDKNILCSPFELLGYFDNAKYVITDTFHGTVISIKRNKQFCTIVKPTNKNKLMDLLEQFNLSSRLVDNIDGIEETLEEIIDYNTVNRIIDEEICRSKEYLRTTISRLTGD